MKYVGIVLIVTGASFEFFVRQQDTFPLGMGLVLAGIVVAWAFYE